MDCPMSPKWTFTARPMSMAFRVQPSRSASSTALDFVRSVVPKQGMVTAMMSLAGRPSICMDTAVMSTARVLSSPPDRPTTAVLAPVCSSRFFSPRAAMHRISLHRSARSAASCGTKGVGETGRVRWVSVRSMSKEIRQTSGVPAAGWKVFMRRRSYTSRFTSTSLTVRPEANRRSARMVPFSAIILWPANTRSVVDSPSPASAYT